MDTKAWLDRHVIPLCTPDPPLTFHSELHRTSGNGAFEQVIVFLLAPTPEGWGPAVKRLLDAGGVYFDYLREVHVARLPEKAVTLFGGDGTPFIGANGMATVRLFKRLEDGTTLLLEVGHQYKTAVEAAAAIRGFCELFTGISVVDLYTRFRPPFGG